MLFDVDGADVGDPSVGWRHTGTAAPPTATTGVERPIGIFRLQTVGLLLMLNRRRRRLLLHGHTNGFNLLDQWTFIDFRVGESGAAARRRIFLFFNLSNQK